MESEVRRLGLFFHLIHAFFKVTFLCGGDDFHFIPGHDHRVLLAGIWEKCAFLYQLSHCNFNTENVISPILKLYYPPEVRRGKY